MMFRDSPLLAPMLLIDLTSADGEIYEKYENYEKYGSKVRSIASA